MTWFIFFLFFLTEISSQRTEWSPGTVIQELDGWVYVKEPTDTSRIPHHLHVWGDSLQGDTDKLSHLTASMLINKAVLLTKSINSLQQEPVIIDRDQMHPPPWWGKIDAPTRRQKRNFLGDALHFFTGVATDDELQEQVKKDNELRDKITATLTRQISYEKEMTNTYTSLAREEEDIVSKLAELEEKHRQDFNKLRFFQTHQNVVKEDVEKLSDILEAVQTGICNTRHAAFLSSRAGLTDILTFQFHNVSSSSTGPVVTYSSRVFRKVAVTKTVTDGGIKKVFTPDRLYVLHPAYLSSDPITEEETRVYFNQPMETSALVLHMGQRNYRTVQPGLLNCSYKGQLNLTKDETFKLDKTEYCTSFYMSIGLINIRHTVYKLDISGDTMLDALLLRSHISTNNTIPEEQHNLRQVHESLTIKMGQEVTQAGRDLDNFILETKEKDEFHTTAISTTAIWLIVISCILLALLIMIVRTCWANRVQLMKAAEIATLTV